MAAATLGLGELIIGSLIAAAPSIATSLATSLVLGGLSKALAPKPKQQQQGSVSWAGRTVTVRQAANPHQWVYGRARVGGTYAWMHARDNIGGDRFLHLAIVFAAHECDAIEAHWFDNYVLSLNALGEEVGRYFVPTPGGGGSIFADAVTDIAAQLAPGATSAGGQTYASLREYLGTQWQADPTLVQYGGGAWTAQEKGTGLTYVAYTLYANPDLFVNGIPQISAVIRGRKVYDPRTGLTLWSDNAALCLADYIRNVMGGRLNEAAWIAAANVCDEQVPLAAGGTERRYTCNGAVSLDQDPQKVVTDLANAMAGYAIKVGGEWYLEAGAYTAPTITLTDADLRAPEQVQGRVSRRENFNCVRGVFAGPGSFYQPDDFPPVRSDTFIAQDSDLEVWKDVELPFTGTASMAQRIAKIDLLRARQQISVTLPCKLSAIRLRAGSTVALTNSFYGWVAKPFRVRTVDLVVEQDDEGNPILGVDLGVREIASDVYDWDTSVESPYDPAPDTGLANPATVEPPGAPSMVEDLVETYAGVVSRATLTWARSASAFADQYQVEYRPAGSTGPWAAQAPVRALRLELLDLAPGRYDFRVKAVSRLGASSAYVGVTADLAGTSGRPIAITGLTLQAFGGAAFLQWDQHPELDVQRGGALLVRHTEATTSQSWEDSYSVCDALPGAASSVVLPLKAGTYLVKARDAGGRESESAAMVETKEALLFAFTTLSTITESPTFPGTKTGVAVDASKLQLSGSGFFDTITSLDAVADLDAFGGFTGAGTYDFSVGADLTTVKRVRIVTTLTVTAALITDKVDSRTGNVDDWLDWDGPDAGSAVDVVIEVRETDDNPAGSPTWSDWKRLVAAEYEARGFQFRARLYSNDPAYTPQVSALGVTIKEVT
jgi:hypothetical protein